MSYDYPEFITTRQQRSRSLRFCCECDGPIEPGETYQYDAGRWDGDFLTFRTCLACVEWRRLVEEPILGALSEAVNGELDAPDRANWEDHLRRARLRKAAVLAARAGATTPALDAEGRPVVALGAAQ